jgi:hypothetical protein
VLAPLWVSLNPACRHNVQSYAIAPQKKTYSTTRLHTTHLNYMLGCFTCQ